MQTFLPFEDFEKCAQSLDNKRLYKQIVECKQILNVLMDYDNAKDWKNHPAVLMWKGYEDALQLYQATIFVEWFERRWGENQFIDYSVSEQKDRDVKMPSWLGDERVHSSHRANLFYKDQNCYKEFKDDYESLMINSKPPYWWPVAKDSPNGKWK